MSVLQLHANRVGVAEIRDQPATVHPVNGDVWIRIIHQAIGVYVSLTPGEARGLALDLAAAAVDAQGENVGAWDG